MSYPGNIIMRVYLSLESASQERPRDVGQGGLLRTTGQQETGGHISLRYSFQGDR